MVKEVHNKWELGMTPEYSSGGYLCAYRMKYNKGGISVGNRSFYSILNKRGLSGVATSIASHNKYGALLTTGQYIEGPSNINGCAQYASFGIFGPIYRVDSRKNILAGLSINNNDLAFVVNDTLSGTSNLTILKSYSDGHLFSTNKVQNYEFSTSSGWFFGSDWTVGNYMAIHNTGSASDLYRPVAADFSKPIRLVVLVVGHTQGTLQVGVGNSNNSTIVWGINKTTSMQDLCVINIDYLYYSDGYNIVLRPSSNFNGTLLGVGLYELSDTPSVVNLTGYGGRASICEFLGDVYVGIGNKINIVNRNTLTNRVVSFVDDGYSIVSINNAGSNLIIWATNGINTKYYYYNGVDNFPNDIVTINDYVVKQVVNDGPSCYGLFVNGINSTGGYPYNTIVFNIYGYQKKKLFEFTGGLLYEYYNDRQTRLFDKSKINNISHYLQNTSQLLLFGDILYIGGMHYLYQINLTNGVISSEYGYDGKYDPDNPGYINSVFSHFGRIGFSQRAGIYNITVIDSGQKGAVSYDGYVVSQTITGGDISNKKVLNNITLGTFLTKNTKINVYVLVDYYKYVRLRCNSYSTIPSIGSVYSLYSNSEYEVMNTSVGSDGFLYIDFILKTNNGKTGLGITYNASFSKVSGVGDFSYTGEVGFYKLLKTHTATETGYEKIFIGSNDINSINMPYFNEINIIVEFIGGLNQNIEPNSVLYNIIVDYDFINKNN